jgi:hypothetical protein
MTFPNAKSCRLQTPTDRDKRTRVKQKYSRTEDDYHLSRYKPLVKQLIEVKSGWSTETYPCANPFRRTGTIRESSRSIVVSISGRDAGRCWSATRLASYTRPTGSAVHAESDWISAKRSTDLAQGAGSETESHDRVKTAIHHLCCGGSHVF